MSTVNNPPPPTPPQATEPFTEAEAVGVAEHGSETLRSKFNKRAKLDKVWEESGTAEKFLSETTLSNTSAKKMSGQVSRERSSFMCRKVA